MKETDVINEDKSKELLDDTEQDDELDNNEIEDNEEYNNNKSCLSRCCCCCCCCCCQSNAKSKNFYQKGWRTYLVKEGNDSSDAPFKILTNLFSNKDGSISALESIRLNPNLVSANKLRNDLEFYIPQLCTFLLFGEMKAIEEFFVFLCKVCNASFFFAHRVHWFLSAMINASQDKKEDIINILKMINTLFKSESKKRRNKLSKFYIANSNPFIKYIKSHNLYFLYDNKAIQNQTNILEEVDYNNLDGYQQEIYNKYKNSREIIINYSENEYNIAKEKEEDKINNKNNKNPKKIENIIEDKINAEKTRFRSNDFFIDISNFKLLNEDVTFEEELEEENNDGDNSFANIQKCPLDINFVSYHSSLNFIDHLCDISNELPKHPIDEQMLFLYEQLLEINKKLPCNVYLPFLAESTRNYLICHIPLDGVKIFRTKTRCPIMLTFEMIRIDEINKDIKNDEEFGTTINVARSKSISSMNSSIALENNFKRDLLADKIKDGYNENRYKNADYDLSKPVLLQNIEKSSRFTTYNNQINDKKIKAKKENEMSVIPENEEEKEIDIKERKSVNSLSSTDSFNEENNNNERFIKIVSRFRRNSTNRFGREANTIFEPKGPKLTSLDDSHLNTTSKNKEDIKLDMLKTVGEKEILNLDNGIQNLEEIIPENNEENNKVEGGIKVNGKNININDFKVFGETFKQKERKLKKTSLFGNLDSHKIFRCIFKTHEDLRQEQFATQLINEFYQIFKLENTGCWLNTYEIISTGNDAGLVEMVNDSVSLDQLKQKIHHASLHDFYLYNYGNGDANSLLYKKAMNNYISSLAGYSLVCYFLQIKDRHNGNILIDNEGHLIHIDFGFLLSNAPGKGLKFENAPFKLSNDMVDCLGGVKGKYFDSFRKLLHKGFIAVNKHRQKISILVEMMWCGHGKNLDCFEKGQEAIDQLKMRLNPKENMKTKDMKKFVDNLISQSVDNWRTKWYDIFQYHVQGIFY